MTKNSSNLGMAIWSQTVGSKHKNKAWKVARNDLYQFFYNTKQNKQKITTTPPIFQLSEPDSPASRPYRYGLLPPRH